MVNMWTEFTRRLAMLFRGRHFDADLEEEMRLHRELREREQIEAGVAAKKRAAGAAEIRK